MTGNLEKRKDGTWNQHLTDCVNHYLILTVAFLPLPLVIRIYSLKQLTAKFTFSSFDWHAFLWGTGTDLLIFLGFALALAIPVLALMMVRKRGGTVTYLVFLYLFVFLSLILEVYFTITWIPLDQVVFTYTLPEIKNIILSSAKMDVAAIITFLLLVFVPLILIRFLRNVKLGYRWLILAVCLLVILPILLLFIPGNRKAFSNEFDYFISTHKLDYALTSITHHIFSASTRDVYHHLSAGRSGNPVLSHENRKKTRQWQKKNEGYIYLNPDYPFLRIDNTPDVLGSYFQLKSEKPNLVVIIVESLSNSFFGDHPYYGSFMPFLDSLREQSLCWDYVFSTSDRTFGVLSAIFGSLPYEQVWNFTDGYVPNHYSLIRYLKENGYFSNFFYGGDLEFTNYQGFLEREGVDYTLLTFEQNRRQKKNANTLYKWGYPDGDLFQDSFKVLDSFPHTPRLDIYLTLSTHYPFMIPSQQKYLDLVAGKIRDQGLDDRRRSEIEKSRDVFSTVLYTDEMLRQFFETYRQRPDFNNTIFVITGDHAMPELRFTNKAPTEKYLVPLIIYSPMLKRSLKSSAISSHLDIAPTLLALLKRPFNLKVKGYCHWVGGPLDIEEPTKFPRSVFFTRNNQTKVDYFRDPYFLSYDIIYKRNSDHQFEKYADTSILEEMKQELALMNELSRYTIESNALIPGALFVKERIKARDIIPIQQGGFDKITLNNEFIRIIDPIRIDENFQYLDIDIQTKVQASGKDSLSFPPVIGEIVDSSSKKYLYSRMDWDVVAEPTPLTFGWQYINIKQGIDLGFIQDSRNKIIKLYIWNPSHIPLTLDSLTIHILGFLDSSQADKER